MRIDWKYLMGLPLDDPGFDHSILSEFRGKVADAGLEQVALDALLDRLAADELVGEGGKQRTDSTHVVAAVAALNRLELAGESVRAALEALAAAHPGWLEQRVCVSDFGVLVRYPDDIMVAPGQPGAEMPQEARQSRMPATGTRCWKPRTTRRRRGGCGRSPRLMCCAGSWCRTTRG